MHCPCSGVNIPRFLLSVVAGFIFVFGLDFVVHQNLLVELYEQTKDLWRFEETMAEFFPLYLGHSLLLVVITGFIFTRHFEGKGVCEGLRFGAMIGVLLALMSSCSYIWMPIPLALALGWAVSGFATGLGLGVIYSLIYRK